MGLFSIVPGADYSAAVGKQGTIAFPAIDPLPILGMPKLAAWLSGFDAVAGFSWADRIKPRTGVPTQTSILPTLATVGGQPAVKFNGAGMAVPPALQTIGSYTWLFVLNAPSVTTTQGLIGVQGTGGVSIQINTAGGLGCQNNAGAGANSDARLIANTTQIVIVTWDATNGFGFQFNNVFDKYVANANAPTTPTSNLIIGGTSQTNVSAYTGNMLEAMHFSDNMLLTANVGNFNWLLRRLAAQYGIALS